MKRIKLIDAFQWGDSVTPIIGLWRRMQRNFFFYALAGDDFTKHETATNAPDMPDFIARFYRPIYNIDLYHCTLIDRAYFRHSRNRYIISLYDDYVSNDRSGSPDYIIGGQSLRLICSDIFATNYKKWKDISDTYFYDYNPIENYNMLEKLEGLENLTREQLEELIRDLTHTSSGTDTRTLNLIEALTGSDTLTLNTREVLTLATEDARTQNLTRTETESLKGFNSTSFVDSDKRVTADTGTDTIDHTGTESTARTGTESRQKSENKTNTGTDTLQRSGSDADTGTENREMSGTDAKEYEHTLTRKGNIGVTTTQQMIMQQREILLQSFLNDVVFPDIDKALTLSVY